MVEKFMKNDQRFFCVQSDARDDCDGCDDKFGAYDKRHSKNPNTIRI